jgi:hypothetical protein
MNKKETNLDGHFDSFDLYFDVKVLKDDVIEILEGIHIRNYRRSTLG